MTKLMQITTSVRNKKTLLLSDFSGFNDDAIESSSKSESKSVSACVLIPTYNEAGNIKNTLSKLMLHYEIDKKRRQKAGFEQLALSVLVIDDNSPDGTAEVVSEYSSKYPNVHLFNREEKNGLGAAYIAGMQHAIKKLNPEILIEMDADGQHNPADVFLLIKGIEGGADFVIGSRYIKGGSIPSSWKLHRRLLSRAANYYTRSILQTGGANDCTGGFRAIRSSLVSQIDFSQLQTKGYAFQVTLLDAAVRLGAKVLEIPIEFHERKIGESKLRMKDIVGGGLSLANLRMQRLWRTKQVRRTVIVPRPIISPKFNSKFNRSGINK